MDNKIKNGLFEINEDDEIKEKQAGEDGSKEGEEEISLEEFYFDDDN